MEKKSYVVTKKFVACVAVRFFFLLPLIFTFCPFEFLIFSPPVYRVVLPTKFVSFVFYLSLLAVCHSFSL